MSPVSPQEEYLVERLDNQIKWYSKKSRINKKMHTGIQLSSIIVGAIIPFLTGYLSADTTYLKYIVGILGMILVILTAINSLYKYQENWILYRTSSQLLKREKYLYQSGSEPYDKADSFSKLVQRVEGILSEENSKWAESIDNPQETSKVP